MLISVPSSIFLEVGMPDHTIVLVSPGTSTLYSPVHAYCDDLMTKSPIGSDSLVLESYSVLLFGEVVQPCWRKNVTGWAFATPISSLLPLLLVCH